MKKLYNTLKVALWCVVGVFTGMSIYQYIDYRQRPDICTPLPRPRGTRASGSAPFSRSWPSCSCYSPYRSSNGR